VLGAPEHLVARIVDGELVLQPRPARRHTLVASDLGAELVTRFRRGRGAPGGWLILDEPELHLGAGPQILVPDLAGWRSERATFDADGAFFDVIPSRVCEVLSPSTTRLDRGRKADIFASLGVEHLWLVDPDVRHIEAIALCGAEWLRVGLVAETNARIRPVRRRGARGALVLRVSERALRTRSSLTFGRSVAARTRASPPLHAASPLRP
jgi:Uma2 family endonuclease